MLDWTQCLAGLNAQLDHIIRDPARRTRMGRSGAGPPGSGETVYALIDRNG
jgi:hypothetical protein